MDNNKLPEIKKEGIFSRIQNFIKDRLGIGEIAEEPLQEGEKETNIKKDTFRESLKVKIDNRRMFVLQSGIEEGTISPQSLNDEDLVKLIDIYKRKIDKKRNELRNNIEK